MEVDEGGTPMPTEQVAGEQKVVAVPNPKDSEWVIRRPERAKVTAEEALKHMETFHERREAFIAAVRGTEKRPYPEGELAGEDHT